MVLPTLLPWTLHEAAAFFDGQKIWVLGGARQGEVVTNMIFSFDPVSEAITVSPAVLPAAEQSAYYASNGSVIYLFGGDNGNNGGLRSIVRFDASTQTVTTMSAQLPSSRMTGGAVWVGQYIYLIGGFNGSVISDIFRYDTLSDSLQQLASDSSLRREQPAVIAHGGYLYIAGGHIAQSLTTYASVVRLELSTGTITTISTTNPLPLFFTGSSTDGTSAFILGGINPDNTDATAITRFDPRSLRFEQVGSLAHPKHGNAWTWANGAFYSLGGMNVPARTYLRTIQRWAPP